MFSAIFSCFFAFAFASGQSFKQPLTQAEEQKYLSEMAAGSTEAKNILIERNLRLVAHIARKYVANQNTDKDDLISVGTIGLIKAVATFKSDKGIKLATYASRCIENEILMHLRSIKKYQNETFLHDAVREDKEGNEMEVIEMLPSGDDSVEEQVGLKMQIRRLIEVFSKALKGRERAIISLRYGLGGQTELTQREIAKKLGISRSYVSRLEKRGLEKLYEEFVKNG